MKTFNTILLLFLTSMAFAQVGTNGEDRKEEGRPIREYNLTIEKNEMTLGGVTANGMTINGGIPGPTLEFKEGDLVLLSTKNLPTRFRARNAHKFQAPFVGPFHVSRQISRVAFQLDLPDSMKKIHLYSTPGC